MKKILMLLAVVGLVGCGPMKGVKHVGDQWIAPNGKLCAQYFPSDHSIWSEQGGDLRGMSYWATEKDAMDFVSKQCEETK